jgi:hypothetical protein
MEFFLDFIVICYLPSWVPRLPTQYIFISSIHYHQSINNGSYRTSGLSSGNLSLTFRAIDKRHCVLSSSNPRCNMSAFLSAAVSRWNIISAYGRPYSYPTVLLQWCIEAISSAVFRCWFTFVFFIPMFVLKYPVNFYGFYGAKSFVVDGYPRYMQNKGMVHISTTSLILHLEDLSQIGSISLLAVEMTDRNWRFCIQIFFYPRSSNDLFCLVFGVP